MVLFDEHTLFFMRIELVNPETHALEEEKRRKDLYWHQLVL